ncbi:MAG: ribonuclease R [bacterium (Candidatus Stahlbacteria) CG23_combo_of_CG06-09_8_20_14_all_34_7]|nr:MAG: ribonuclease R [bacterium (Candidatus Stahlbacteria) CG23_combo_of_CG06-09_8_20_14_all_34_7]
MLQGKKKTEKREGAFPSKTLKFQNAPPILSNIEKQLKNKLKRPLSKKEIAKILSLKSNDKKFENILNNLILTGKLIQLKNSKYGLSSSMEMISGIIEVNPKGFGFLIRDDSKNDIFIPMHLMSTALDKDRVLVKIIKSSRGAKEEGKVISVLERRTQKIIGTLKNKGKFFYVIPDDRRILKNIFIDNVDLRERDAERKVIVKLNDWESPKMNPTGDVVEFVDAKNKVDMMGTIILMENGFETKFPNEVEYEAERINFDVSEISGRKDLRNEFVFTIDPVDAKDFDDAVSIEKKDGNYRIGVHIADVSYFVKENSLLDKEAYKRGTSVYLIDKTVPMLPEKLSNEICSLKEREDRFTFTCEFTLNQMGKTTDYAIFPSVIKSKKRFTYEEAEKVIDGDEKSKLKDYLMLMIDATERMKKYSIENNRIDFDIPEIEIILSDKKEPILIREKKHLKTHKMVEHFMVAANNIVSEHLFKKTKRTIYRSHPEPDMEKLDSLRIALKSYGYRLLNTSPRSIQNLIEKSEKTDNGFVIREMILRSMMKAKYSTSNEGHYGLGLDYYTHFTSPIRRYPDLIVHRQLKSILSGIHYNYDALDLIAKHCTEREWAAERAERDSEDIAKMYYINSHPQKDYEGIISSVTQFGLFIQLKELFVEGLVKFRDMDDDFYRVREDGVSIIGIHKKNIITMGDKVQVKVLNIDADKKMLDLKIIRFVKKYH